jgi:hypothetical protein
MVLARSTLRAVSKRLFVIMDRPPDLRRVFQVLIETHAFPAARRHALVTG